MSLIVNRIATEVIAALRIKDDDGTAITGLVFNSAGLSADYRRPSDAAWQPISLVAGTLGTWSEGGFVEDADGDGWYQIGLPDVAISAGETTQLRIQTAGNGYRYGSVSATGAVEADGTYSVTVPALAIQQTTQRGSTLYAYRNFGAPILLTVVDSDGAAVDLSAMSLAFAVESLDGIHIATIRDLTPTGDGFNVLLITLPSGVLDVATSLRWSLADETADAFVAGGTLEILEAAQPV